MSIAVDGKNPPTFTLSGSGNLNFFLVMEVPPENQSQTVQRSSDANIVLWEIWPTTADKTISRISPITYGKVPQGFTQKIPVSGEVPPLIEGKIYEVGGTAHNANGGFIWITIRNGQLIEIPIPGSQ
jgi:hypothetical protein